jgi:CRP-like cAMP-binding protein
LAAQLQRRIFKPGQTIVHAADVGHELYIIQSGIVEVWKDPEGIEPRLHTHQQMQHMANLKPGQITGELSMFDQGTRSADLIAGPEGVTLLTINRERLLALCEDDAVLGTRLMWNMSTAMAKRVRFVLWQLNRAEERRLAAMEQQKAAIESTFVRPPAFTAEQIQTGIEA